jgi:chromosome segregation ATPase
MPQMADDLQLSNHEIGDALADLNFFSQRAKRILALGTKLAALKGLLAQENDIRGRLGELEAKAAAATAVAETADAAQKRLDNIETELEKHRAAWDKQRDEIVAAACRDAEVTRESAKVDAKQIVQQGLDDAAAEAESRKAEIRAREAMIRSLDADIAAHQEKLAGIKKEIANVLARIGG